MLGEDGMVHVTPALAIPRRELSYHASRAGGPGGQHVNKTSSRVELRWNVAESPSLTSEQRGLLVRRLATRLDRRGQIRVVAEEHRSQLRNREAALERFVRLIAAALYQARPRRKTRPTKASVERRLEAKRRRAVAKKTRGRLRDDE